MRFCFVIIFLLFSTNNAYANSIVYLDLQFIIDKSELGQKYKKEILDDQTKIKSDLKIKQNLIKEKENELNSQKNVLKKDEFNNKLKKLDDLLTDYREFKKKHSKIIIDKKKKV